MIYGIIQELKNTSGTNDKIDLVRKYSDNELFKRVLRLTYDNNLVFKIKKFKQPDKHSEVMTLDSALDVLEFEFATMKGSTNESRERLTNVLSMLSKEDAQVLELVLKKDLKCGISVKTINKAFGYEFIMTPRYMGACSYNKKDVLKLFEKARKANAEVWSEIKYDGMYINLFVVERDGKLTCAPESRGGKRVFVDLAFENDLTVYMADKVFMGELLVRGVDRYTSNGMINSYTTIREKEINGENVSKDIAKFQDRYEKNYLTIHEDIYMKCWDFVSMEEYRENKSEKPLYVRRAELEAILEHNENVECVEYVVVENPEQAMQEFKKAKENGEEGTILKNSNVGWKDGKPKDQLKFKLEFDVEMKVTGWLKGNPGTKYENFINRLLCESSDGLVKIRTSALTEDDMEKITAMGDDIIGKIITVQCSGLSENNKGEKSLLHPRFMVIREDKSDADSYEDMIRIEEMCSSLEGELK